MHTWDRKSLSADKISRFKSSTWALKKAVQNHEIQREIQVTIKLSTESSSFSNDSHYQTLYSELSLTYFDPSNSSCIIFVLVSEFSSLLIFIFFSASCSPSSLQKEFKQFVKQKGIS